MQCGASVTWLGLGLGLGIGARVSGVRVGGAVRRVGHLGRDGQRGEGARLALELLPECVDVVEVDVRIADAVHKVAWVGLGLGLG